MDQKPKCERYAINFLEENIKEYLPDLEICKYFLNWKKKRVSHKKKGKRLCMKIEMSTL